MSKVLILFAHPALEKSRVHTRLIESVLSIEDVTFHDLYENYPDLDIDVSKEQQLLLNHDIIIWQHPFYWYSSPAIIKQWQDLVLEHGWAYGSEGKMLAGKYIFNAISCGGPKEVYTKEGRNRFTIRELLAPFVVHGTHRLSTNDIDMYAEQYRQLITALVNNQISKNDWQHATYLNELCSIPEKVLSI